MADIGILIRTINEAEFLPRTLSALYEQSIQSFETVVVDSGSTDDTLLIASSYEKIKIIEIPRDKFTYGYTINKGIEAVAHRVRFIVNLSAHAIPINKTWLENLMEPFSFNSKIVGVYGKQIPLPEHLDNPIVSFLANDAYPKCYGDKPKISNKSYFFSNANSAITIEAWQDNPFDESLPYSEDQNWAKIAISKKNYIAYQPTAVVYHSHPDTFWRYFIRSRNEAKAKRIIHSDRSNLIGTKQISKKLGNILEKSVKECLRTRSVGKHCWYRFCVQLIRLLADYRAAWELEHGK